LDGNSKTQSGCLKPLDTGIGPFAAAGYYIEACFGLNSFETAGLDLLRPSSRFVGYAQPSMRMLDSSTTCCSGMDSSFDFDFAIRYWLHHRFGFVG
jgi:hypothetical protein